MNPPAKAVVLCAGLGSRMEPLSRERPKPLMPVWGRPALRHTLDRLAAWGVKEVLINLHHAPQPIVEHILGCPLPIPVSLSFEPLRLGTGGALRRAEWFIGGAPFWLINGDVVFDVDPDPFLDIARRRHPLAVLWVTDAAGPRTVEVKRGRVADFRSPRAGRTGTCTFCGLHLLSPAILDFLPPSGSSSIIDAYVRAMGQGRQVAAVQVPGCFWADIGTPPSYIDVHRRTLHARRRRLPGGSYCDAAVAARAEALRRAGVRVGGFAAVDPSAVVRPGARLEDSVIWEAAVLSRRAKCLGAVVAADTRLDGASRRMALPLPAMREPAIEEAARALGWPVRDTTAMPLDPRGSARTFTRLQCGRRRAVVVQYTPERPENMLYARNADFLRRLGVRVPAIFLDRTATRLLVLEDVGDRSLLDRVRALSGAARYRLYTDALDAVWPLHRDGARAARRERLPLAEPFSAQLYRWERELFLHHFMARRAGSVPSLVRAVMAELKTVADRLLREPPALIHRDLQSTNVHLSRGELVFLDFQGMRMGAAVYDLASLLCDPYASLDADLQRRLVGYYAGLSNQSPEHLLDAFWWAAVERLVQALGAYGRLGAMPETAHFSRHTQPGLDMLARAVQHTNKFWHLQELLCYVRNADAW